MPTLMVEAADERFESWWKGRYTLAEHHERMRAMAGRGMIAGMINAEQRELRKRGVKIGADEAPTAMQRGGHHGEMTVEIASLKRELAELRAMVLAKK